MRRGWGSTFSRGKLTDSPRGSSGGARPYAPKCRFDTLSGQNSGDYSWRFRGILNATSTLIGATINDIRLTGAPVRLESP